MAGSVENELFCVFSYYSLITNPLDPEHMSQQQWVKFLKHCQIVKTRRAKRGTPVRRTTKIVGGRTITAAEAAVYYTREVTRRDRNLTDPVKKMNYDDFLNALMRIAHEKLYAEQMRVDESFQALLMKNVLPFDRALRRKPDHFMRVGPGPLKLPDFSLPDFLLPDFSLLTTTTTLLLLPALPPPLLAVPTRMLFRMLRG